MCGMYTSSRSCSLCGGVYVDQAVSERREPALAIADFDCDDWVDFPRGAARLADLIWMCWIHHEPSADAHLLWRTALDQRTELINHPARVVRSDPWRDFSYE